MPATAVAITPQGWLTDVDLGDPDLGLAHLRALIGCAAVRRSCWPPTWSCGLPTSSTTLN